MIYEEHARPDRPNQRRFGSAVAGGIKYLLEGRYPFVITLTGSCARPLPSSRLWFPLLRGKIKALGMFSRKRVTGAIEVPTVAEAGGPALESSTWVLLLAPAGTPPDIVYRASSEVAKALAADDVKSRLEAISMEVVGSMAEQASTFLDDEEVAKWSKVIKTAGVKVE